MSATSDVVFLFDVDDTLLNNDAAEREYSAYIRRHCGATAAERYWTLFEQVREEVGYADYLGALQRYRLEELHEPRVLLMSSFLLDYPFDTCLYPRALDVIRHVNARGPAVVLSDGDAVFQPRKIERSGIRAAVAGRVLVYVHKEQQLADVERFYPAARYVLIDDKPRVLAAVKQAWGARVTTVWPQQGHYARDADARAAYPTPDITLARIGDLLQYDLPTLLNVDSSGSGT